MNSTLPSYNGESDLSAMLALKQMCTQAGVDMRVDPPGGEELPPTARGGTVRVRLDGQRGRLGGQAVTVLRSELLESELCNAQREVPTRGRNDTEQ